MSSSRSRTNDQDRLTAATASPGRRWVGIRTYRTLHIFPASELIGESEVRPRSIDLAAFGEEQGEALVLADDGTVWTTTEADKGPQARLSRLQCTLAEGEPR